MERLIAQLEGGAFDWYVAISRGGLIPACLLAQDTGVRHIDTICVRSYEGQARGAIRIMAKDYAHLSGARVLLVDDLVDSGATMEAAVQHLMTWRPAYLATAVIYKKSNSAFAPDFFVEERAADEWIRFEWEKEMS